MSERLRMSEYDGEIEPFYFYSVACNICGELADGLEGEEGKKIAYTIAFMHQEEYHLGVQHSTTVYEHPVFMGKKVLLNKNT